MNYFFFIHHGEEGEITSSQARFPEKSYLAVRAALRSYVDKNGLACSFPLSALDPSVSAMNTQKDFHNFDIPEICIFC